MDRRLKNALCAASAGVCGSSAGLFGKIGMTVGSNDQALYTNLARFVMLAMVVLANIGGWLMYTRSLRFGSTLVSTGISIASNYIFTALYTNLARFVMLAMVVLANIGGWLMYTRSLRFGSTLVSTGISIASNYIFTALTGVLLFAESCSILWACGTLSVMIGVILMSI